jgi:hypothetical protein
MCTGLEVKDPLFLSNFSEKYIFLADFQKIFSKIKISLKSVQVGAKWEPSRYARKDGRTDMTKFIFALRNFANVRKNNDKAQLTLL